MTTNDNPTHFDQLYPGRFLRAGDTSERPTLTIARVVLDELEGEKGTKQTGIVLFKEDRRGLVLNKTNGYCLRRLFGPDLPNWIGRRVTLFRDDNVQLGREKVSAIRVYGSPEIESDITVEIKHPKKKAYTMTLRATGEKPKPAPHPRGQSDLTDDQKRTVTQRRERLAELIRRDEESAESALQRAREMAGQFRSATFAADLARIDALIAEREEPAPVGAF